MKFQKLRYLFLFMFLVQCSSPANLSSKGLSGDLIIFHAGSLSVPFREIATAFQKKYPKVNVILEAAGSRECARKIADLKKPCDVFASADDSVIDSLLIPEHASWSIKFATNEMVLVYHDASKYSQEITADNWYDILLKKDVAFGRSDPNLDPCGYRAVFSMELAEEYYKKKGLSEGLLKKELGLIRPKETDLLALLEVGEIDYIFLYRSLAEQHGLKFIIFPDEVNLKKEELNGLYERASIALTGKTPHSFVTQKGGAMIYGVTIPKNASHPKLAKAFVEFLLEKENGLHIMEKNSQSSVVPSPTKTFDLVPKELKRFVKESVDL